MPAKSTLISRTFASSSSPAVLQSGMRCPGGGLGAGVGGEAGADGRKLCGMLVVRGLLGVWILCGCGLRFARAVEDGNAGDGGGSWRPSWSEY
jgi:hypothetical protein